MAIKDRNILIVLIAACGAVLLAAGVFPALRAAGRAEGEPQYGPHFGYGDERIDRVTIDPELAALVDSTHNVILDEAGSLDPFLAKLAALRSGRFDGAVNILHIGDSHVQAGFWDSRLREHFTRDFGTGGRGAVLPHRLTGTNEPRDYYIRTTDPYEGFRVTSNPTREKLSFTGTGLWFDQADPEVELWTRGGMDAVTVIRHPQAPPLTPPAHLLLDTQCTSGDTGECTTYYLNRTVDTLRLHAAPADLPPGTPLRPLYYGFVLHGGSGVEYHSIGANSAAFEHFERQTTFTEGGAGQLFPDLIIISLGTNNCYGRNYRTENLRTVVERFLGSIAESYPGVPVLVTTPRESCQRSGRRYAPNPNIEDAAGVIRQSAAQYGFACWDLYRAAGGRGIAEKWFETGLSGRDRIHLTERGYTLVGDMMYNALADAYNRFVSETARLSSYLTEGYAAPVNINPNDAAYLRFAAQEITGGTVPRI